MAQMQRTTTEHTFFLRRYYKANGEDCGKVEKEAHKYFLEKYQPAEKGFDGYSECFYSDNVQEACEILEKLFSERGVEVEPQIST